MLPKKAKSMPGSYSRAEELLSASSHGLGFIFALVGLVILLQQTSTYAESFVAVVYGVSLALMFLSSTLYHVSDVASHKVVLRKIDHTAIYLLIAGTYTPVMMLAVGGGIGIASLIVIWLIGILGITFKLTIGDRYPKLGVITYACMGWFALLLIYPIYLALSPEGFMLLIIGGLLYSAGIPFYMLKSRHYSHALWHLFVVAGAACHFFMFYCHII